PSGRTRPTHDPTRLACRADCSFPLLPPSGTKLMTRLRSVSLFVVSLLLLTVTGCNFEYDQGYRQGVQDVQETRRKLGVIGEAGMQVMDQAGAVSRPER